MSTYKVLYNPHSGNGCGEAKSQAISAIMPSDTFEFCDMTQISDYRVFFESLKPGEKLIIAGGGGTLNRFINDTETIDRPQGLLYFATGSGNDFLHDLGAAEGSAPVAIDDYIRDLPIVTVNGKDYRFLNGIGYGIDGYCCEVGDKMRTDGGKPVNYTAIAIKGLLFHYKTTSATVTVDGVVSEFKRVWLAPTMNGRFYGGGMMPTPAQNRLNPERKVSTMVYYGCGKLKALIVFPSIFKGEHVKKEKMVKVFTGSHVNVKFDAPVALQIDGETILGVTEYSVRPGSEK